jgi:hypothetical protein
LVAGALVADDLAATGDGLTDLAAGRAFSRAADLVAATTRGFDFGFSFATAFFTGFFAT